MDSLNRIDVENENLKKDILGFIKSDAEILDCLSYFNCTGRHKLVLGTFIEYGRSSLKGGLFTEEDIKHIINHFDEFAANNEIINKYLDCKFDDQIEVKKQISDFYVQADKKILKEEKSEESIGETNAKVYRLVNGNKQTGTDIQKADEIISLRNRQNKTSGYIGAFVISALAATIEITTILYIVLKGM